MITSERNTVMNKKCNYFKLFKRVFFLCVTFLFLALCFYLLIFFTVALQNGSAEMTFKGFKMNPNNLRDETLKNEPLAMLSITFLLQLEPEKFTCLPLQARIALFCRLCPAVTNSNEELLLLSPWTFCYFLRCFLIESSLA